MPRPLPLASPPAPVLAPVLACLLALLLAACTTGLPGGRRETVDPPRRTPLVYALGDSYTVGVQGGATRATAFPAEAARRLGWRLVAAGHAGTGFVGTGRIGKPFATLFQEQLAWRDAPDLVIVSGGHNDVWYRPARVERSARSLLDTVRRRWPGVPLVLVGPLWGGDPGRKALAVRDLLGRVAAAAGATFLDPLAERWITGDRRKGTGNAPAYIRSDGTHPNAAGNAYLAGRFAADLRAAPALRRLVAAGDARG
ncbi:SGNH/GDSL hydrolase family protein [Actinomadura parmotrematis]|uniref:SGNH/GDSL hydrolase family protein n=1 Tax=Actinomadura parmotrematis TaxID=2864039 RepID=A0ABS7G0J4_9ACTN|nr:SGNH/GDSL hydrolase family protein [Actinomadura parmotrematis]MBW8485352.1 SGNH/GDSL hydrolase family protein [Actinomadura parmotrematis]